MQKNKQKDICKFIIAILFISILVSIYYSFQILNSPIPVDSDDAGTFIQFRDIVEYGTKLKFHNLDVFYWIGYVVYLLLGESFSSVIVNYSIRYGICIFMLLWISMYKKNNKIKWEVLPLLLFFILPGSFGVASCKIFKYHIWASFISLLIAVGISVEKNLSLRNVLLYVFLGVWGLFEGDILVIVSSIIPFVSLVIYKKREYIKNVIGRWCAGVCVFLIAGRVFLHEWRFNGYGSGNFPMVCDIWQNINVGITGILGMFNIELIDQIIFRFDIIFDLIKLLFLFYSFTHILKGLVNLFKGKGDEYTDLYKYMLFVWIYTLLAFLFGGKREDEVSARYMLMIFYSTIFIGVENLSILISKYKENLRIKRVSVIGVLGITLCICSLENISIKDAKYEDLAEISSVISQDNSIKNGIGSFWRAGIVEIMSEGNNNLQSVVMTDNGKCETYLTQNYPYYDGTQLFNFFVEYDYDKQGISEENLKKYYGEYVELYDLSKSKIYVYDYDVRTKPLNIPMDSKIYIQNNSNYNTNKFPLESKDSLILENIDMTVGKIRIELDGVLPQNDILISTNYNDKVEISYVDGKALADIEINTYYRDRTICIRNSSDERIIIEAIRIVRLSNAIMLEKQDKYTITCGIGDCYIGMVGTDIDKLDFIFDEIEESMAIEKIQSGNKLVLYKISSKDVAQLRFKLKNDQNVSYVFIQNDIRNDFSNSNVLFYTLDDGMIYSSSNNLIYGPYVDLEKGKYKIMISGKDIESNMVHFTKNCGENIDDIIVNVEKKDNVIVFSVETEDIQDVECVIENIEERNQLYYIEVLKEEN